MRRATDPIYDLKRYLRRRAAAFWRRRFDDTIFIGITGSYGKTSATGLLGAMLEKAGPTKTSVFHNSAKRTIRAILRTLPGRYRYFVQEVSGDRPGAVADTITFLQPTVGIVTTIGGDHRQNFRSLEATAAEKSKLVHQLPLDGLAVLNIGDPLVEKMGSGCRCMVVYYGRGENADLRLISATSKWPARLILEVEYRGERFTVKSRLIGTHWCVSVMAALLAALELGVSRSACLEAIATFEPVFNRLSVHNGPRDSTIILDAEKASNSSMEACLEFLGAASASRKTAVIGTISDHPGAARSHYHRCARIALNGADRVFFTGKQAQRVRRLKDGEYADRLFIVESTRELHEQIARDAIPGELIYIKASRADQLHDLFVPRDQR